ncbi:MAG: phosphoenolpyruvate synthase [Pseudomonadota bacterium]
MADVLVVDLGAVRRGDVGRVGGKNASLGEMIAALGDQGIRVPGGFATTAEAYWRFVAANGIDRLIGAAMAAAGKGSLAAAAAEIRAAFEGGRWPEDLETAIRDAYRALCAATGMAQADVAVRSSATAEDLPDASFAGQQETYLNIRGEAALLDACRRCYASLFTDRAVSYREAKGFAHDRVALSVGVQRMVRSDLGGAGVMFSLDTETGCDRVVVINAAHGLGENVVQGSVDPDEYLVFKPLLRDPGLVPIIGRRCGGKERKLVYAEGEGATTVNLETSAEERRALVLGDAEILQLARWACAIEAHYGTPMDIEWARDGRSGELFIVQARPETVHARADTAVLRSYAIADQGPELARGLAIGDAAVTGTVCRIDHPGEIGRFVEGAVLVAKTTSPDWVPIMKRARAIVTDHGGRTSHAAIVSRELGVPAVIGTGDGTRVLADGAEVTVSCAGGAEGVIYAGAASIRVEELSLAELPATRTRIMLNLADPEAALRWWRLPADGVGLARMEFVIDHAIRVHPMALVKFDELEDAGAKAEIARLTAGYPERTHYFVERLALGLARIAAVQYPNPVIVRLSDFKTNEYAHLLGGAQFEPREENPMLGFRGASRYYSPRYREGFALECRALRKLREEMGFDNVVVMVPFCRTPEEADRVLEVMAEQGLKRGERGLQVYVMGEIPSNVVLAAEFARRFDGFSIGSNDLTQLTLGVERDSELLAELFSEQDAAVQWMIRTLIRDAHAAGAKVGLCGQAPSDHPEFAGFLVECGIDSISVTPDRFAAVKRHVAAAEERRR